MDFDLSDEQESFRKVVRDFAESEIAPFAEQWDRDHTFPLETVKAMGQLGLFGLPFPEEYGGSGADFTTMCVVIEELARVDSSMAVTVEAGVGLGRQSHLPVRHRGAAPDVAPRPVRRPGARAPSGSPSPTREATPGPRVPRRPSTPRRTNG